MSDYHHKVRRLYHKWEAGDVVRVFDGPFGDAVVLGFNDEGRALLARPYAYSSLAGTTCASVLLGSERMEYVDLVRAGYKKVDTGRIT